MPRQIPDLKRDPHSDAERLHRMQQEMEYGFKAMHQVHKAVSFFGSARTPQDHPEYQQSMELSRYLGSKGWTIITGGGPGIMEAANRGAQQAGALSVGLNIDLYFEPDPNPYQDLELHFHYFFARKIMFVRYASGFIAAPGGFGTMDEIFEALTLVQTRKVGKFPVILLGVDYWQGLIEWMNKQMLQGGKTNPSDMDILLSDDYDEILEYLEQHECRPKRS